MKIKALAAARYPFLELGAFATIAVIRKIYTIRQKRISQNEQLVMALEAATFGIENYTEKVVMLLEFIGDHLDVLPADEVEALNNKFREHNEFSDLVIEHYNYELS